MAKLTIKQKRRATVLICLLLVLIVGEIVARIAIAFRWESKQIDAMTQHTNIKGNYMSHHYLPYVLTPNYKDHNSYGFRGKEFDRKKDPNIKRIVCIGASTTYGIYVKAHDTYCAKLQTLFSDRGIKTETINAGVPGWVSTDSLLNFQLRIIPLEPDLIIVYQGRNEVFPQSFNNFKPDYSHFRVSDYSFSNTNWLYKPLFRASHLFMLLSVYKGNRFGWSGRDEHPAYGQILFENQPTDSELIDNLREPDRTRVYRNAVTSMVSISEALGIKAILGTMAFRAERFATGVLNIPPKIALEKNPTRFKTDPAVYDALQNQVEENNETIREVASRYNAIVAETASLATEPEFFRDDCHFNREGHARRAVIFFESILESGFLTLK